MSPPGAERATPSEVKRAHVQLNRQNLKGAMEKRIEKRDKKFLDHDIVDGLGPWGKGGGS